MTSMEISLRLTLCDELSADPQLFVVAVTASSCRTVEARAAAEAWETAGSGRDAAAGHQGHQQNAGEAEQGWNRVQSVRKFPQAGGGLDMRAEGLLRQKREDRRSTEVYRYLRWEFPGLGPQEQW